VPIFLSRFVNHVLDKIFERYFNQFRVNIGLSNINGVISKLDAQTPISNLWDCEVRVYSQWGEDGILSYLTNALKIAKPKIIEFGVGNFAECNSRFLAEAYNASVYGIDGRKDLISNAKNMDVYWRGSIHLFQDWITPTSAPAHLEKALTLMKGLDILSLDIDGNDFWVMNSLNLSNIKIIVCEYNPIFGGLESVCVPRDDYFDRTKAHYSWLYYGVSLRSWINLMEKSDHRFIGTNRAGNNAFFIKKEFFDALNLAEIDEEDLQQYVDWRIREGRDQNGSLLYENIDQQIHLLTHYPLIDTVSGKSTSVGKVRR
jgi:hypothetical protein